MSVHVMVKFPGAQREKLQEVLSRRSQEMVEISEDGRSKGARHHMFVADVDGGVLAVDEWESAEQFQAFFSEQQVIPKIAAEVGGTGEPVVMVYEILDTPDRF